MKVTSDNNTQLKPATVDKESSRSDLDVLTGDEIGLDGLSEKTSFASVLDRVTQARKEPASSHTERHSDGTLARQEHKARQKDDSEDNAAVAVPDRALVREPIANPEPSTDVNAVLPAGDLEKIVAACRVQVVAGERHEVTLDLSRSVLDGLRVKVSADSAGRITTEFLAANDGIKSLLDARSSELIALLRSRGVNLATFKSSVAADGNGGSDAQSRQDHESKLEGVRSGASHETEPDSAAANDLAIGATYRA